MTAVGSQGVRKFAIPIPGKPKPKNLPTKQVKLWVFTPDLLVSTSALETIEPVRVAKILWREEDIADGEADGLSERLSRQALSEGELVLPDGEVEALMQLLNASADWLPQSARTFGGMWNVGLLERFTQADLKTQESLQSNP